MEGHSRCSTTKSRPTWKERSWNSAGLSRSNAAGTGSEVNCLPCVSCRIIYSMRISVNNASNPDKEPSYNTEH